MKNEFYVVLSSRNSCQLFTQNKPTQFTSQLSQNVYLPGEWSVALVEIQIPLTIQHITQKNNENMLKLQNVYENQIRQEEREEDIGYVTPGIYTNLGSLLNNLNNISCIADHVQFELHSTGFVHIKCISNDFSYRLVLSNKLRSIIGFKENIIDITREVDCIGDYPANLINALPNTIMIYTDICEPYDTGDEQSRLLRIVPLDLYNYKYGGVEVKSFSLPMYIPLLSTTFQSIDINIRDENGEFISFDYGTSTVILHFKRTN